MGGGGVVHGFGVLLPGDNRDVGVGWEGFECSKDHHVGRRLWRGHQFDHCSLCLALVVVSDPGPFSNRQACRVL